jgi:hypothetical protein
LLHKRANPVLPPYLLPHSPRELKPFTPPLPSPSFSARTQKKSKICFVIYIAGFFFKKKICYEVNVKQIFKERPANHYGAMMPLAGPFSASGACALPHPSRTLWRRWACLPHTQQQTHIGLPLGCGRWRRSPERCQPLWSPRNNVNWLSTGKGRSGPGASHVSCASLWGQKASASLACGAGPCLESATAAFPGALALPHSHAFALVVSCFRALAI